MSCSGINNYIKSYNFFVKSSKSRENHQIALLEIVDRKEQHVLGINLQTQENMDKLRREYADKQQLTAFNLAFYLGLRAKEISAIHDSEFKRIKSRDKIPEHYVVTTSNEDEKSNKPITTFNVYMIEFIDKMLSKHKGYWFFGDAIKYATEDRQRNAINKKAGNLSQRWSVMWKDIFGISLSLEDIRRTYCSNMYAKGVDSSVIQNQMRHKHSASLLMYVDGAVKKKRKIEELVQKIGLHDDFEKDFNKSEEDAEINKIWLDQQNKKRSKTQSQPRLK